MIALAREFSTLGAQPAWWPGYTVSDEALCQPTFSRDERVRFLAEASLLIHQSPHSVRQWNRTAAYTGPGAALARWVCAEATYTIPVATTPGEWLSRVAAWHARHHRQSTAELPPSPWDEDKLSDVHAAMMQYQIVAGSLMPPACGVAL